jgi:hypothetical protein
MKPFVLRSFYVCSLLLVSSAIHAAPAEAPNASEVPKAPETPGTSCANGSLDKRDAEAPVIGDLDIRIHPIFDENNPDENNWLFRTVNRLHIDTRKYVIEKDLLFSEGDAYNADLLAQSERILRTRRYLNRAAVTTESTCDQPTKVNVDVYEVWTLVPELTFSHTGGNSSYGAGIRDSNFLGLGKTVNLIHTSNSQRTGNLFSYYDPNLGWADSTLGLGYANNSDGTERAFNFARPFVAVDTPWSTGVGYDHFTREDSLYNAGKEALRFAHEGQLESVFYGWRLNKAPRSAERLLVGYTRSSDYFAALPDFNTLLPDDREFNYPWIEYQHFNNTFIKAENIQQINRVEDYNLGAEFRVRLGYAKGRFQYADSYIIESEYQRAYKPGDSQLLTTGFSLSSYYGDNQFYNGNLQSNIAWHLQDFSRGQFYVGLTLARGLRRFADEPLELGGDTGLRGYPARYQAGDHLHLITVEQRYFGKREWFSLFHMGAAIFYDEGRVWGDSAVPQDQRGQLRDVGIGLRISGTRTGNREEGTHNVLHIDLASPLDGDNKISKLQWLVKVKKNF